MREGESLEALDNNKKPNNPENSLQEWIPPELTVLTTGNTSGGTGTVNAVEAVGYHS
jgi:hypothetical protein